MQEQTFSQEENSIGLINRVRDLEGKYNLLRDRVLVVNNNMIEEYKRLMSELKIINNELRDLKGDVFKIKESMKHVIKEFELFARKDDVVFLEKYINLWNPLKFVTEEDVLKIIEHNKKQKEEKKDGK